MKSLRVIYNTPLLSWGRRILTACGLMPPAPPERTADSRGQSEARPLGDGGGERRSCVASGGSQRVCVCCASWSGDLDARASTTTCTRTAYRVLGVHGRTSTTRHGHTTVDAKPVASSMSAEAQLAGGYEAAARPGLARSRTQPLVAHERVTPVRAPGAR